jgi:putative mycofactocin binding protein MftB
MTTTVGSLLEQAWRLSPSVALRPEPFGALAYHFGNRKLTFLKRPELVSVVRGLERHDDVRSALWRPVSRRGSGRRTSRLCAAWLPRT